MAKVNRREVDKQDFVVVKDKRTLDVTKVIAPHELQIGLEGYKRASLTIAGDEHITGQLTIDSGCKGALRLLDGTSAIKSGTGTLVVTGSDGSASISLDESYISSRQAGVTVTDGGGLLSVPDQSGLLSLSIDPGYLSSKIIAGSGISITNNNGSLTVGSTAPTVIAGTGLTSNVVGGNQTLNLNITAGSGVQLETSENGSIVVSAQASAEAVFQNDIVVSLSGGKTFGRYTSGETIPATGLTAAEVLALVTVEPIDPTVTLTSQTTISFNQTNISNTVDFSHTINSLNATVATAVLQWRRGNAGGWTTLSSGTSSSGTYTHSLTDTAFNTATFNYRYTVTDTVGASAVATLDITPAAYQTPTISLTVAAANSSSPETALKREKGNVASNLSGTVTRRSSLVELTSYTLQYSTNNSTWVDVGAETSAGPGTFAIPTTLHNDTGLKTSSTIYYRVKVMDTYQQHLSSTGVNGGNKTVSFLNMVFYDASLSPIITSTAARSMSSRIFSDGSNPFDLTTGATYRRFTVALPSPSEITLVNDVDALNANITDRYSLVQAGFDEKVYTYATDNTSPVLTIPVLVRDTEITQVAAGNNFVLALDVNGRVHAWGSNDEGQLNVPVAAQSGVTKITAGIGFAYVLKSDGTVVGWGNSDSNRFDYTGLTGITDLFSGWFETLFINSSGAVIRRGSSTGVNPAFNISTWSSGVTGVAVGRYNMVAVKDGAAVVTGHSNHNALTVPAGLATGVTSVHANGGTVLWAKKGTSYYGWGKADSGEMSELHAKIQAGDLGTVTSTYTAGNNASAQMIINDPDGAIAGFIPTQGYQLGVRMTDGRVFITGLGNLPDDTLPDEIIDDTSKVAIGGEIVISLGANNDRRFFIDDAGGTPTLYNVYTMTNAEPYDASHIHRVTRS